MVKVLYITGKLVHGGGVTGCIMNYYRHIDPKRIQIDFLVLSENSAKSITEEIISRESKLYCVPVLENIWGIWNNLKDFFYNHGKEYPVVHSHIFQLDGLIFYLAKKYGSKICISHAHTTNWSDYRLRAIRNRILAFPIQYYADVFGACSIATGEFLYGKNFLQSSKRWLMHNAIEVSRMAFNAEGRKEIRETFKYANEIVLGTIGRVVPIKNQSFLLDIMKAILDVGKTQYRLLIVGDGELRGSLEAKAKRLGVNKYITFTGMRSDIPQLLWAMDIFLLPSYHEGLPVAGIEAQASGLPCLFSNGVSQEAEVVDVQFLSLKDGPEGWAKKILRMDVRRRMDAVSKIIAAGYDIETEARRATECYEGLAEQWDIEKEI